MNSELIKKLADEARIKPMDGSWAYRLSDEFEEKFAELIVRECAGLVRKHNYQTIQNEEPLYGITSPEILEHFGVEE